MSLYEGVAFHGLRLTRVRRPSLVDSWTKWNGRQLWPSAFTYMLQLIVHNRISSWHLKSTSAGVHLFGLLPPHQIRNARHASPKAEPKAILQPDAFELDGVTPRQPLRMGSLSPKASWRAVGVGAAEQGPQSSTTTPRVGDVEWASSASPWCSLRLSARGSEDRPECSAPFMQRVSPQHAAGSLDKAIGRGGELQRMRGRPW
mmetsp:Transcript_52790/g.138888  ORF Transcript_52790/g.138888 Transcript_52790/m.138888 type:complete len:202 (+) Transcript_52790:988-1593(+)